jgi:type IV secretory pathway TraG/TraD family ATPase VirD4
MNSEPNTQFAGDSSPNSDKNFAWGASVLFFLAFPLAVITALVTYAAFSWGRISYKVILAFVGAYALILLLTGNIVTSVQHYLNSWSGFVGLTSSGFESSKIPGAIFSMLGEQFLFSFLLGGIIGSIYCWWRWIRRPTWQEVNFRLTPYQWFMKRKNIADIKANRNGPADGRTLGVNEKGEKIVQSERESVAHTLVVGAAGSGKTTTVLASTKDYIRRGEGVVIVDMKGSVDIPRIVAGYAKEYGRTFRHWTSQDPRVEYDGPAENGPAFYDSLGRGDATRRTSMIMSMRKWNEEYFMFTIQDYLQRAIDIAIAAPPKEGVDSLQDIMALLDPTELKKRSLNVVGNPYYDQIIEEINYMTDKKIDADTMNTLNSMKRQLGVLRDSIQGRWLRKDPTGQNDINIFDVAHKGEVVVFTVDSANYEHNAKILGNLIIQDLKTVSSELRNDKSRYPLNVIIEEFSAIGSDNIIGLIARSRDAGIPVTLTTQSLGDLRAVSDAFLDQLAGIVVSFIIHRANSYEDAEKYAGLSGKEMKPVFRQSVEHTTSLFGAIGRGSGTGRGSVDMEEDYKVNPSEIQALGPGQLIYICKNPNRIEHVNVIVEERNIARDNDINTAGRKAASITLESGYKSSLIPDYEDTEKYKVNPAVRAINLQKDEPVYADSDFSQQVPVNLNKRADPDKIREIFGKKLITDTQEVKEILSEAPPRELPQAKPKALPALEGVKVEIDKKSLPPIQQHQPINKISALPKMEKAEKNVNARPIRPRQSGNIALPPIFPQPKATPETFDKEPAIYNEDVWEDKGSW